MLYAGITLGVIGAVLGFLLGIADRFLKVEVDNRIEVVTDLLPGLNCGVCGNPGCAGMATALVEGTVSKVSVCKPSSQEVREKIRDFLNSAEGIDGQTLKVEI